MTGEGTNHALLDSTGQVTLHRLIPRIAFNLGHYHIVFTGDGSDLIHEGCLVTKRGRFTKQVIELVDDFPEKPGRIPCATAATRPDGDLLAFAGRRGFLRQAAGPGWALVGDAGYFKDPITAHGITDALRDASLLAEAAATGNEAAFGRFAAQRDALSLPLFRVTDQIAGYDWTLDEAKALHLALNKAMKHEVAALAAEAVS